jgi:hypothetical protein
VCQVPHPSSTERLEEFQLVPNLLESGVPLISAVFIRYNKLWTLLAAPRGNKFPDELIWDKSDDNGNRERDHAKDETDCPLSSSEISNREGVSTNKDDQNLSTNDDELDADEPAVAENAFEDVKAAV